MRNPNVRVLVIAVALIAVVAAAALIAGRMVVIEDAPEYAGGRVQLVPAVIPKPDADTKAYLRIQVGSDVLPFIPLTDGGEYRVIQPEIGAENVVHTTAEGIVMHSSTCKNQDCVLQEEATLQNRDMRVLSNLIVCLPNQVILEILTPEEIQK